MNYNKINNLTGWIVFAIATVVYVLTLEPTSSFWDCGEFISTSYKLMVPHPPGAPFFLLIGRFFSFFASDVTSVAYWINMVSALSSSFTILFLFWTITLLAKKLVLPDADGNYKLHHIIAIMGSGVVGSLAFTFSDTFWFSSEEAEVYAMSSFFTAFVFWALLKWENNAEKEGADRLLILVAYMIGLSIGVHLLNLVALPALAFIYYFKKFKPNTTGIAITFVISVFMIFLLTNGVITGLPSVAKTIEVFMVNGLSLPFGSGILFFMLLIVAFIAVGIYASANDNIYEKKQNLLRISLYIGMGTILLYLISQYYEVSFVNNPRYRFSISSLFFSLVLAAIMAYPMVRRVDRHVLNMLYLCMAFILIGNATYGLILIRSQSDPTIDMNNPENVINMLSYLKREQYGDRPLLRGPLYHNVNKAKDYKITEPVYKIGEDGYEVYDGKPEYIYDGKYLTLFPRMYSPQPDHVKAYQEIMNIKPGKKPTFMQNIGFLFKRQIGFFWARYFMWNFAGRSGNEYGSGWISPTEWFDKKIPAMISRDKARNNYFMLPLLLGLVGAVYHFMRDVRYASIVTLLFFFTGIAIVIYLNQPPNEPRERDYTSVGSFYAFAIWIGLGVLYLNELLSMVIKQKNLAPALATCICLIVPGIMAAENWDDHNRSGRYHSVDSAKNLLNSCAPNAILFTGGDNDTYPLWYVQEVEGFRTDVRVCNLSLINTDWYIDQMRRRAYLSDTLPISLSPENVASGVNDQLYYNNNPKLKNGIYMDQYIRAVNQKSPMVTDGKNAIFPTRIFVLPVDTAHVNKLKIVPDSMKPFMVDKIVMHIDSSKNYLEKKTLVMMDILVNNQWKRPLYFSTTLGGSEKLGGDDFMWLKPYMQLEGLAYRLLPVRVPGAEQGWINTDTMYKNMVQKFYYRNLDNEKIFYDENYLRFTINLRSQFGNLASQLLNEGKNEKAKEVIMFSLKKMPHKSIPYDGIVCNYIPILVKVGERKQAEEIMNIVGKESMELLDYVKKKKLGTWSNEFRSGYYNMYELIQSLQAADMRTEAEKYEKYMQDLNNWAQTNR
ncbi:MAG: DUF2723 domain-containing protein [Cytophagaceae bacterium]|nr:DUF2723 domain-containing protein [Cytophagaceae bacterium]MDW8455848.1 DUF2723 domain-containing protein [Cytophagaceae bacterium]